MVSPAAVLGAVAGIAVQVVRTPASVEHLTPLPPVRRNVQVHASISGDSVVYVRQAASGAAVWHLDLVSGRSHRVYRVPHGTGRALWSTATNGASAYFTVYTKSESLIWHA